MKCSTCGHDIEAGSSFCTECGAPVRLDQLSNGRKTLPKALVAGIAVAIVVLSAVIGAALGMIGNNSQGNTAASFSEGVSSSLSPDTGLPESSLPSGTAADSTSIGNSSSIANMDNSAGLQDAQEPSLGAVDSRSSDDAPAESAAEEEPPRETNPSAIQDSSDAVVLETEDVRISMPAPFAEKGFYWEKDSAERVSLKSSGGNLLGVIVWGESASRQDEGMADSYIIGTVSHGTQAFTAFLRLYYYAPDGAIMYAGNSDPAITTTSALVFLDTSLEEVVSWIELYDVDKFVPAQIYDTAGQQDASVTTGSDAMPFYGVWIGASKDADEAQGLAQSAISAGLQGVVYVSTDWSNLNPEPWYVVAAGAASSEADAEALCAKAQASGYADAYVKYSGDYIGS